MAESFQSLLKSFRDVTHSTVKNNKDTAPVKLLIRTVKSLETVLATLDKFLKTKGIDVGQAYEQSKNKAKSLAESGKKLMDEAKENGVKATATNRLLDIKSKLSNTFSSDTEKAAGPPGETTLDKAKSKFTDIKDKIKDKLSANRSPLEEKKSWLDRLKQKTDSRKAEVEAEKKSVQARAAGKKGGGWLGKILSGVMTMGGMVVKGIGKSLMFMGGFLLKGFSKALFALVPSLAGGIARATQAIVGKGLALAGRGALGAVKLGARALLPMAGSALGMAARGAAMIATGPVGWVVAAGTAIYAGYKLYKYLTRNNIAEDLFGKLTRLRLLMYGVNDVNKEYYSKIFDLEMLMKDYVKFTNYQVQITKLDSKAIEKVLELFGVSRDEKEKYAVLNTWFMKRFIPAYKAFLSALYSVNNNIYLDQIDKLKPGDLLSFITKFSVPGMIYNVKQAPTGDQTDILVKKEDVDALYTNICNEVKAKAPKSKTPEDKARDENRQAAAKQQAMANAKKDVSPVTKPPVKSPVPMPKEVHGPDTEGEKAPTIKDDLAKTQAKVAGKLNKASGQLTAGGMSLEGISTKLDKSKIYNLDPNVRELFTGMAKEYNALTGKNIPLNEAFRSFEDQAELYRKMPGKAAKPGNSTHEYGLAIDINSQTSEELDKMGLLRKYGFSTAIGGEKWHLEPIGVSMNPTLAKNDENFRTKAILSSPGNGGGGYGFLSNSIMKRRDTNYQMSIFNNGTDNPIDTNKVAEHTATTMKPATTEATSDDPSKISTSSKMTGTGAKPMSMTQNSGFTDEGETKPSIPTSKSPIGKKEDSLSLDSKAPTINKNLNIGQYAELPVEAAIRQAAKMTNMDEDTLFNFAKIESSLNPNARNKSSSAGGLFQITDDTWNELMQKHAGRYNIPQGADKFNPFYNAVLAGQYSKDNLGRLSGWKEAGMEEPSALYLGHHYGVTGANKILKRANQNPDMPVKDAVSEGAYSANRQELGNKSVGDYLTMIGQKIAAVAGKIFKPQSYSSKSINFDDDSKMGGSSIAASNPPMQQAKSTKTSSESYMVRPAKLSMTSGYAGSMNNSTVNRDSGSQETYKQMFDTSGMETIMANQLTELRSMVGLLRSIDGKVGQDKAGAVPAAPKTPPPPVDRNIPSSSIDLSRRKLNA